MATFIPSEDWVLAIKDGTNWEPIVCLRDVEFSSEKNPIEVKTFCGTTQLNSICKFTITANGSAITDATSGQKSWVDLEAAHRGDTLLEVRFGPASPSVSVPLFEGDVYVNSFKMNSAVDREIQFSITLGGNGDYTVVTS